MARTAMIMDEEDLAALEAEEDAAAKRAPPDCPRPTTGDLENLFAELQGRYQRFHEEIRRQRETRYLNDELPEKWRRWLKDGRRIHTRLSHNEIMRVVALQTANTPRVVLDPAGSSEQALKRARKQRRWLQALLPALERGKRRSWPLRRRFCDNQAGDGLGVYEVYLTDAYERRVNFERKTVVDKDRLEREETDAEYLERTEQEIIQAGLPFGVRRLDPLSVFVEFDEDEEPYRAIVAEYKPYRVLFEALGRRYGQQTLAEKRLPRPGEQGWPYSAVRGSQGSEDYVSGWVGSSSASGDVLTIRYYDRYWYVYAVGGVIVEAAPHRMPGVPLFFAPGMTTGAPELAYAMQGVTWGLQDLELLYNDMLTLWADNAYTYSKRRWVITTDVGGEVVRDPRTKRPERLNLSNPDEIPQLLPGQKPVDMTAGVQTSVDVALLQQATALWQRSGLNPIAQGESPGSDAAGYTVNTLTNSAIQLYTILIDNEARCLAQMFDFVRSLIRDTIQERVYLSAPVADSRKGGTEWLALGPDDIDETPCRVVIDPRHEANRMAVRQSLMEANRAGYISRSRVQQDGFGIEDTDQEDDEIILDRLEERLADRLIEMVLIRVNQSEPFVDMATGEGGTGPSPASPGGSPVDAAAMVAAGGTPAAPQPPTVGAANQRASTQFGQGGQPHVNPAVAMAGQGTLGPVNGRPG